MYSIMTNTFLNMIIFTNPEVVQLKLTSAALYNSQRTSAAEGVKVTKPHVSSLSQPENRKEILDFLAFHVQNFCYKFHCLPLFA